MKRVTITLSLLAVTVLIGPGMASADTADKKIALSNNYAGNSWRQAMLRSWDKVTKQAVADGRRRGRRPLHHRREPGDRAGGADPEPDPAGLQRDRAQRRLARRAQRRDQGGLRRRHHRRLLRRHRHRALRLARSRSTSSRWARTRSLYLAKNMPQGGNLLEIRGLAGVFVDDAIIDGHPRGRRREPAVQDRRLGARRLGPGHGPEGGRRHPAQPARDHRRS